MNTVYLLLLAYSCSYHCAGYFSYSFFNSVQGPLLRLFLEIVTLIYSNKHFFLLTLVTKVVGAWVGLLHFTQVGFGGFSPSPLLCRA